MSFYNLIRNFFPTTFLERFSPALNNPFVMKIRFKCWKNDYSYLKDYYKYRIGIYPNLDNPVNFNEKSNWRKLHDRKPIYTDMVDKYKIKSVVENRLGKGYTIPLIKVYDKAEDIDLSDLPNKFVLKVNHAGGVIICREKSNFNLESAVRELNISLKRNSYLPSREWPYKDVERKIICEQYMGENLTDYKIYCFNGVPRLCFVWENEPKKDGHKPIPHFCGAFDMKNWEKQNIEIDYATYNKHIEKPSNLAEMYECAKKMSDDTLFVRTDLYVIEKNIYVGEMTFFPWGGFIKFKNEADNIKLGNMLNLYNNEVE